MPGLNNAWKTFGCTKCTNYPLLVLEACIGRGDSKSDFTAYITKNNIQYPCVWHAEGGMKFDTITNNEGYSNPKHLIFPNKTSKELSHTTWEKQLDSAGIKPHVCGTAVVNDFTMQKRAAAFIRKAGKESFIINTPSEGYYSIVYYAMNGGSTVVFSQKHFFAGTHTVNMSVGIAAQGVYLAEIRSGSAIIREKVIVE